MSDSSALRVAVIGLGNLGLPMAQRLQEVGFGVVGYDESAAARARAGGRGIAVTTSVAQAGEHADVACLAVGTAEQVGSCLEALGGSPAVRLVHATLAPSDPVDLAETVGVGLVDAPVSGGPELARTGELAVMVGGDDELVARAMPVLEALGRVLPTGPVGSAQTTKLIGQMVFMTTQGALLEGERLATAQGVAWSGVLDALGAGTGDCWAARHWGFFDAVAADYERTGVPPARRPWAKDLATTLAVAADRGLQLPLTTTAARVVPPAIDAHARP